jgi:hypothetical protein
MYDFSENIYPNVEIAEQLNGKQDSKQKFGSKE